MTRDEAIAVLQEEIDGNLELTIREWRERDEQRLFPALRMAIEALSERPKGDWIDKDGELVCSVCGNSVSFSRTSKGWVLGKFCQSCGTKMKGGDTE